MLVYNNFKYEPKFNKDQNDFRITMDSEKSLNEVINRLRHDKYVKYSIYVERKINGKLNEDEMKELEKIKNMSFDELNDLSIEIRKKFNEDKKINTAKIITIKNTLDSMPNTDEVSDLIGSIDFFMFQNDIDNSIDNNIVKYYKQWYLEKKELVDVLSNYINLPPGIYNYNDLKINELLRIVNRVELPDDVNDVNMDFVYFWDLLSKEEREIFSNWNLDFRKKENILYALKENEKYLTTSLKSYLHRLNKYDLNINDKLKIYDIFGNVPIGDKYMANKLAELIYFLENRNIDKVSYLNAMIRDTSFTPAMQRIVEDISESIRKNPERTYMFSEEYYKLARQNMYNFATNKEIIDLDKYFQNIDDNTLTIKTCSSYEYMKELYNKKFNSTPSPVLYRVCVENGYDIKSVIDTYEEKNLNLIEKYNNPVLYELGIKGFKFKGIPEKVLDVINVYASKYNINELISLNIFFKTDAIRCNNIGDIVKKCNKIPFIYSINKPLSQNELESLGLTKEFIENITTNNKVDNIPLVDNLNIIEKELFNIENDEDKISYLFDFKKKYNLNFKKEFIDLYDPDLSPEDNLKKIEISFYPNLAKFASIDIINENKIINPKTYAFFDNLCISIKSESQFRALLCELDNIFKLTNTEKFKERYPKLLSDNIEKEHLDYKINIIKSLVTESVYEKIKKNMYYHASKEFDKEIDINEYIINNSKKIKGDKPVFNIIKSEIMKEFRNYKQDIPKSINKLAFICKETRTNVKDFVTLIDFENLNKIDKFNNENMLRMLLSGIDFSKYSENELNILDSIIDKNLLETKLYSEESIDKFLNRTKVIEELDR